MRRGFRICLPLVLLCGGARARGDYVTNGGFETGDFTGWSQSGDTSGIFVSPSAAFAGGQGGVGSTNGAMGFLSQTVTTPVGSPLDLAFFLAGDGSTPNEIQVSFGGTLLLDQTNLLNPDFIAFKLTVTPTSANNVLEIGFRNDNGFFAIDDVAL